MNSALLATIALIGIINSAQLLTLKNSRPKQKQIVGGQKAMLDTCALIDGRIIELSKAGFMPTELLVPRAVLRELQFLADGSDSQKRERARFGLDIVQQLQSLANVNITIVGSEQSSELVDDQLITMAKQYNARLYTTDFNLNKVANVEGVTVLNVNELAQALRPQHLPGETAQVKLVQPGQENNQAVGYLDDGTMVVVDKGRKFIGKQVEVSFTRMLQTQAGKMTFATITKGYVPRAKLPAKRPPTQEDALLDLINQ